jgi:hypothetical protein
MKDIAPTLKHNTTFTKGIRSSDAYVPVHPSDEALICLNCDKKKCKPTTCQRYKQEVKKIKDMKVKKKQKQ